jgi:hypothetical protein
MATLVPAVDEQPDRTHEILDASELASADGLPVMFPKNTSTRFSHEPDVGVK